MSSLAQLKLTAQSKPAQMSAIQQRRNKLVKRVWEQMELAKAQTQGSHYAPTKFRTVTDRATGARKQVETSKRVKQWWFTTETGKLALSIRYGSKVLELAPKKFAVELASDKDLVATLELIKTAVLNGELDTAIDLAANKLRDGFTK